MIAIDKVWAYWPFDEINGVRYDYTDNKHDLNESWPGSSGYIESETGKYGRAAKLDHSTEILGFNIENIPPLNEATTLSFWFKSQMGSGLNGYEIALTFTFGIGIDSSVVSFSLYFSSELNRMAFCFWDFPQVVTDYSITLDEWHFAVMEITNSSTKIWLDNVLFYDGSSHVNSFATSVNFSVTDGALIPNSYCLIDDLAVYADVISEDDRSYLWNDGVGRTFISSPEPAPVTRRINGGFHNKNMNLDPGATKSIGVGHIGEY